MSVVGLPKKQKSLTKVVAKEVEEGSILNSKETNDNKHIPLDEGDGMFEDNIYDEGDGAPISDEE
ncbi:hypothetical protein KI387_010336, partial [Taxus chinensis]